MKTRKLIFYTYISIQSAYFISKLLSHIITVMLLSLDTLNIDLLNVMYSCTPTMTHIHPLNQHIHTYTSPHAYVHI